MVIGVAEVVTFRVWELGVVFQSSRAQFWTFVTAVLDGISLLAFFWSYKTSVGAVSPFEGIHEVNAVDRKAWKTGPEMCMGEANVLV